MIISLPLPPQTNRDAVRSCLPGLLRPFHLDIHIQG